MKPQLEQLEARDCPSGMSSVYPISNNLAAALAKMSALQIDANIKLGFAQDVNGVFIDPHVTQPPPGVTGFRPAAIVTPPVTARVQPAAVPLMAPPALLPPDLPVWKAEIANALMAMYRIG